MGVRTHKFTTGKFNLYYEEIHGLCCYPETEDKEKSITINPKLRGRERMDVIIHESLHAEFPSLKKMEEEEWVDNVATNISKLLWRMGYR